LTSRNAFIKSCVPQATPPIVSLLPLMNLVKLCTTTSAPNCAGETLSGENVLSTTKVKLCFFAILESALISATSKSGLLTVSQYNTFVFLVIAASTSSRLVMLTNDVCSPNPGAKFFKNAYVPPYIVLLDTMWSFALHNCINTAVM